MNSKLILCLFAIITIEAHAKPNAGQVFSPTIPKRTPEYSMRNYSPVNNDTPWELEISDLGTVPMPNSLKSFQTITENDLLISKSTQFVVKGEGDDRSYFIKTRKADGTYRFIIAEKNYQEMLSLGNDFSNQDVLVVTDEEYATSVKEVDLVVLVDASNSISQSCANGIAAGAITGALSGVPAGTLIGGFAGALAGGCFDR